MADGTRLDARLHGRTALVTGATSGIGRAIAFRLAAEGANVVVAGRDERRGADTVATIVGSGGAADFVRMQLDDENSIVSAVESSVRAFGGLTTLVNNAAPLDLVRSGRKPLVELSNEEWRAIVDPILMGSAFWTCKHALPHLAATGSGSIVNVSAMSSLVGLAGYGAYSAAKGAVNALARCIAVEHAADGVRSNTIAVGRISAGSDGSPPAAGTWRSDVVAAPGLLTRLGVPDDVAATVAWLASDDAAYVTGATIAVDGGISINAMPSLQPRLEHEGRAS